MNTKGRNTGNIVHSIVGAMLVNWSIQLREQRKLAGGAAGLGLGESQQLDARRAAQWAIRYCNVRSVFADTGEHRDVGRGE
ncbi:MAG: hypothetical protein DME65_03805 [Verrucomicrobia bacterium]|nr:MAG: hypothetical protein DME65_03805 [Verrucomicrobiota bacterium]